MKSSNTLTTAFVKGLAFLVIASQLIACGKKADDQPEGVRTAGAQTVRDSGAGTNKSVCITGITTFGTNQTGYGTIYDSLANETNFDNQIAGLLSATIDPKLVGFVSAEPTWDKEAGTGNGVWISGVVNVTGGSCIQTANSGLNIEIFDDQAEAGQAGALKISLPLVSVQGTSFNLSMTFGDDLGTVTLNGSLVGNIWQGNATYQNKKNVTGAAAASGTLGQFKIPLSYLIQAK